MSPSEISKADTSFDQSQFDLPYAPGVEKHFWQYARNRIIERHLRLLTRQSGNDEILVLDVGCGPGIVVGFLRQVGINCYGVELGRPFLRPGLDDYIQVDQDATKLPQAIRQQVRIILLLDVIEHIERPEIFLRRLLGSFENLQHFVITVPARMELWSNYDEFYGHFVRYDKRSFFKLAADVGLRVGKCKYFFVALYPVMWILSRFVGSRSLESRPPKGVTAFIHRIIGSFFLLEERIPFAGHFPGTSVIGIMSRLSGT
jgi:SAM-dependent methyltransferase